MKKALLLALGCGGLTVVVVLGPLASASAASNEQIPCKPTGCHAIAPEGPCAVTGVKPTWGPVPTPQFCSPPPPPSIA